MRQGKFKVLSSPLAECPTVAGLFPLLFPSIPPGPHDPGESCISGGPRIGAHAATAAVPRASVRIHLLVSAGLPILGHRIPPHESYHGREMVGLAYTGELVKRDG